VQAFRFIPQRAGPQQADPQRAEFGVTELFWC
jgi:hypothetical protein